MLRAQVHRTLLHVPLILIVALITGCSWFDSKPESTTHVQVTEPTPLPQPEPIAKPLPPKPEAGTMSIAYPTLDRATSYALIETKSPTEVRVGQPFDMTLVVTNLSDSLNLTDIVVTDPLPDGYTLVSADPVPASTDGNIAKWNIGKLAPKQSKTIYVKGSTSKSGALLQCASMTCTPQGCTEIVAVSPALKLTKSAPKDSLICDPIPVKYVVSNTGTGSVRNARVRETLPQGVVTDKGATTLDFDAGTLAAGQSREFTANLKPAKTGALDGKAFATADGGLASDAATSTAVHQPVLIITNTGRKEQYIGRPITYDMTVTNNGDWTANDTLLVTTLPPGTKLLEASANAKVAGDKVQWSLGNLDPKAGKRVTLTLSGSTAGTVQYKATASAYCADPVSATAETLLKGIPAVLLEVVDISDPIEVGKEETYEIVVTNQGSANDTNIAIVCTLDDSVNYVTASGPTEPKVEGKTITFTPLKSLAPKGKATWKLVVNATKPGDTRLKVSMETDQTDRPVEETESTHFYE